MTVAASLVLAAHGSSDPRFAAVVDDLAAQVADLRPDVDVRVGYLEHGPPELGAVVEAASIVVPLLLSGGYHLYSDIPAQAPGCVVTAPLGPDPRLAQVLSARLDAAGWDEAQPVVLAAIGSSDPRWLADVERAAADLGSRLGVVVPVAFLSAGQPRLDELVARQPGAAVAAYLLAPGRFSELATRSGAPVVSAPLGADPLIASIILDRFDTARISASGTNQA